MNTDTFYENSFRLGVQEQLHQLAPSLLQLSWGEPSIERMRVDFSETVNVDRVVGQQAPSRRVTCKIEIDHKDLGKVGLSKVRHEARECVLRKLGELTLQYPSLMLENLLVVRNSSPCSTFIDVTLSLK